MEHSNSSAKLVGALVAGAAIGVAIGLLLAPEKGSDARKKVMDGASDLADKLKDILNNVTGGKNEAASEEKTA